MSARKMPRSAAEDLFAGMYTLPKAERQRRIDAFAHELAEKIRDSDISNCCSEAEITAGKAADLIDPEVER